MPYIVQGEVNRTTDFSHVNFDYEYPGGLDLKPGSELHNKIKTEILKRAVEASGVISNRFTAWNNIDRVLTTYVELDEKEKEVVSGDERKPVSIVFPYSDTILETLLGYLVAAFFEDPIFRYEGVSPEDTIGAILLEKIIDLQCYKSKVPLELHTMFRDGLSYGFGIVIPSWVRKYAHKTVKKETGFFSALKGMFINTGFEKELEKDVMIFEGNALTNVDPYLSLPDPSVPIHRVQDGEFFGWVDRTNYMDLLSEERDSDDLFNVKYLKSVHNKQTSIFGEDKSDRERKAFEGTTRYTQSGSQGQITRISTSTTNVDVVNMYVKLIPREWKLGDGEYPEKWLFSLAADDVIIRAQPIDLDHNMFPVAVCAPDFDGYSTTPISRLEKLFGLQKIVDWLFNAHIANVRKAINDMIIFDPYLVNSNDLRNPKPGKLIRLRRPAWGRGVKDVVAQLDIKDITRQNIADTSWIVQWMDRIGGANEAAQGGLRGGGPERLTAAEFQGTQIGQFSRLERIAKLIGIQAMQDIGFMFASHTQQLMEQETFIKATGRWQEALISEYGQRVMKDKGRMKVTPFDILVDYDIKVRDGSIPGGNYSDVWVRMFEIFGKYPEIAQRFDVVRIFKHIARNAGAKNVDDFVRFEVASDEDVANRVDQGSLVPTETGLVGGQ